MREESNTKQQELDWSRLLETALTAPGSVGNVYNRFYNYSFLNQMLLLMQGVHEPVATYKRWQTLGRQVLRGSKAHAIVRPIIIEKKNDADEVEERVVRFKIVNCLFGVSQTEGDELPAAELPQWDMERALGALSIRRVPFELLDGNTQGYSSRREFAVNPVAVDPVRTTFHELGHIVLGHTEPDAHPQYVMHRGVMEFEAEATAYLTMNELDQLKSETAPHSRGYIQAWLRGERPDDASIRRVFAATTQIIQAGHRTSDG
jgi:antirestriction protein ArdC